MMNSLIRKSTLLNTRKVASVMFLGAKRGFHSSMMSRQTDPNQYVQFDELDVTDCIKMLASNSNFNPSDIHEMDLKLSEEKSGFTPMTHKTIGVITINRPEKMNSLCPETAVQFKALMESSRITNNNRLAAIILTGAPPAPDSEGKMNHPAFSAGGDYDFLLERIDDTPFNNANRMSQFYDSFLSPLLRICPVPTIACMSGHAVGAGLGIACATDIRVMEATAKMSFNFVKIGLSPGMGSSLLLPYLVGHQVASYMLLTGDLITAQKAKEYGVVLDVMEGATACRHRSFEIAVQIAKSSHIASRLCLHALRVQKIAGITACMYRESDAQVQSFADEEMKSLIMEMKDKEERRKAKKQQEKEEKLRLAKEAAAAAQQ
ncbi:Enoyl-CoA hydratase [Naegleria gruberi]|uniref:Enoyl-CoA hydratase n=1 Tax=Naegleria gruberi TaxID=5762 RepID=D2VUF3_NAEGR|nr:Enoyl-CoA hydratase [Naegleria gruberi]EFC39505.1 Enoyl-CoA hydratase [Naegleria gruberi]|eukprot:XP_002672249.1 Enoyl-CoA hydratase [Naegleria gruberi strain NEG-M]